MIINIKSYLCQHDFVLHIYKSIWYHISVKAMRPAERCDLRSKQSRMEVRQHLFGCISCSNDRSVPPDGIFIGGSYDLE